MDTSQTQINSPEDPAIMFDIYGEELKNSNSFSTPSQYKEVDEKNEAEYEFSFEEEKKTNDDKENQHHTSLITPYKIRNNNHTLLRSPLYDITPCPKTKNKDSCNVTPVI